MEYLRAIGQAFDEFDRATRDKLTENFREKDDDREFRAMCRGYKRRAAVLDDLIGDIDYQIEQLEKLANGDEEQQEVFREYDGLLAKLREYKEMAEKDSKEAEADYRVLREYDDDLFSDPF